MSFEARYFSNPRVEMHEFVPVNAHRVLDVGCGAGTFAAAIKARNGSEVWGVEPDARAARMAEPRLDRVFASTFSRQLDFGGVKFGTVVFNDVLEHMAEPEEALRLAAELILPGGCVVASIPNLRNAEVLREIVLDGDFRYRDSGILDRTHLRFFTRKSIIRLFESTGYRVVRCDGINATWSWRRRMTKWVLPRGEELAYLQFAVVAEAA